MQKHKNKMAMKVTQILDYQELCCEWTGVCSIRDEKCKNLKMRSNDLRRAMLNTICQEAP